MEFLANENFPLLSVMLLRNADYRVVSIAQESPGITDFEVLTRAHEENMVILTFDRDYGELIYKNRVLLPAGVVYFRFGPATPAEPADIIIRLTAMPWQGTTKDENHPHPSLPRRGGGGKGRAIFI